MVLGYRHLEHGLIVIEVVLRWKVRHLWSVQILCRHCVGPFLYVDHVGSLVSSETVVVLLLQVARRSLNIEVWFLRLFRNVHIVFAHPPSELLGMVHILIGAWEVIQRHILLEAFAGSSGEINGVARFLG